MSLIYITGNAGTGKSTVCVELQERGYDAYDEAGIAAWYDKTTGEKIEWPHTVEDRTRKWYSKHIFKMSRAKVEQLAEAARSKTIFLCGQTFHDHEVWDLFDKTIYLTLSQEILKQRLAARTNSLYGKAPDELADILGWHGSLIEIHRKHGAIMVDAAQPLGRIVDEILSKTIEK